MKVAVVGCTHGRIETIYETISHIEQIHGFKVCHLKIHLIINDPCLDCQHVTMISTYTLYRGHD